MPSINPLLDEANLTLTLKTTGRKIMILIVNKTKYSFLDCENFSK